MATQTATVGGNERRAQLGRLCALTRFATSALRQAAAALASLSAAAAAERAPRAAMLKAWAWNTMRIGSDRARNAFKPGHYFEVHVPFKQLPSFVIGLAADKHEKARALPFAVNQEFVSFNGVDSRLLLPVSATAVSAHKGYVVVGVGCSIDGLMYLNVDGERRQVLGRLPTASAVELFPFVPKHTLRHLHVVFTPDEYVAPPHARLSRSETVPPLLDPGRLPDDVLGCILRATFDAQLAGIDPLYHSAHFSSDLPPFQRRVDAMGRALTALSLVSKRFRESVSSDAAFYYRRMCELHFGLEFESVEVPDFRRYLLDRVALERQDASASVIHGCELVFKCPLRFADLEEIASSADRSCSACNRTVYLCEEEGAAREHIRRGHCIAFRPNNKPDYLEIMGEFI